MIDSSNTSESNVDLNHHGETAPAGLISLPESEKAQLAEALQELLAHGSIIGTAGQSALYRWCRQNLEWLREAATLLGLDVTLLHEERLVQAIPRVSALRLNLRQDATLVWLALWYAGDVRWRDEGEAQAFLSVEELNALLSDQLLPDVIGQPLAKGRLKTILRQAARFNLIRFSLAEPFEESGIEVLPTIRRIIPFRDLTAWAEAAAAFNPPIDDTNDAHEGSTETEEEV
ncbi:MAG TPA: hypothetical protein DCX06_09280 [Opitutae bacterium]|nr:hypothetical protein [Opitutae bacterium]